MKRLSALAVALLVGVTACYAQTYVRNGKEFSTTITKTGDSQGKKTGYTWKDSKCKVYDIYVSSRGSCYIIRTSAKTGKQYKSYLPKEVSKQIARELGIKK